MTFRLHYLEQQEAQSNVAVQACRREPYLGSPSGVGTVQAQTDMSNDHRGSLRNYRSRQKFGHHPSLLGGREQVWGGLSCAVHTGSRSDRPDKCGGNQEWVVCLLDLWDQGSGGGREEGLWRRRALGRDWRWRERVLEPSRFIRDASLAGVPLQSLAVSAASSLLPLLSRDPPALLSDWPWVV